MAAFKVYEEKREAKHELGKRTVTRTLRVEPYGYVGAVLEKLLGTVEFVGGRVVRTLPHRDPVWPDCWCVGVDEAPVEALDNPAVTPDGFAILDAKNTSDTARLIATYKTADAEQQPQGPSTNEQQEKELASESWDFGAQQFKVPDKWFAVGEGTDRTTLTAEGLQLTKTIPTVQYQLVRHFCPRLPDQAITQLMARVNYDVVTVGGRRWAKEMLRFDGLHAVRKIVTKTRPLYELSYKFAMMPIYDRINDAGDAGAGLPGYVGWNRIFWAAKAYWTRMTAVSDPDRTAYLYDYSAAGGAPSYQQVSQSIGSRTVKGLDLLFHPGAA